MFSRSLVDGFIQDRALQRAIESFKARYVDATIENKLDKEDLSLERFGSHQRDQHVGTSSSAIDLTRTRTLADALTFLKQMASNSCLIVALHFRESKRDINTCIKYCDLGADSSPCIYLRGFLEMRQGEYEVARTTLHKVVDRQLSYVSDAMNLIGCCTVLKGETGPASTWFANCCSLVSVSSLQRIKPTEREGTLASLYNFIVQCHATQDLLRRHPADA